MVSIPFTYNQNDSFENDFGGGTTAARSTTSPIFTCCTSNSNFQLSLVLGGHVHVSPLSIIIVAPYRPESTLHSPAGKRDSFFNIWNHST
jgi:hypothetical protein